MFWTTLAFGAAPTPILPSSLSWVQPPGLVGVSVAWVLGAEASPAPYVLRVRLAKGAKLEPHVHPDDRTATVLWGTVHVGFGEVFDPTAMVAMGEGVVWVVPANVTHFVWAKDGSAEYQEFGRGPTGTTPTTPPKP